VGIPATFDFLRLQRARKAGESKGEAAGGGGNAISIVSFACWKCWKCMRQICMHTRGCLLEHDPSKFQIVLGRSVHHMVMLTSKWSVAQNISRSFSVPEGCSSDQEAANAKYGGTLQIRSDQILTLPVVIPYAGVILSVWKFLNLYKVNVEKH
jgi:hypothetical protein